MIYRSRMDHILGSGRSDVLAEKGMQHETSMTHADSKEQCMMLSHNSSGSAHACSPRHMPRSERQPAVPIARIS